MSHEQTITVEVDGKWWNIPTVIGGKKVSDKEATDHAMRTGQNFGTFGSLLEADTAAKERSASFKGDNMADRTIGQQMHPPGGVVQGNVPASATEFNTLQKSWTDYFTNPQTQAALLQFGVSMLQPRGWFQTGGGHIGMALADAGAAAGRVTASQQAEQQRQQELGQQQLENQQRERQIGATERSTEAQIKATEAETVRAEKSLSLEERKLYEYLIPMMKQQGAAIGGGGKSFPLRERMILELQKNATAQAGLDPDFDMEAYITNGMSVIDRLAPATGATPATEPPPSTTDANAPQFPPFEQLTDDDIVEFYGTATAEQVAAAEQFYGTQLLEAKDRLLRAAKIKGRTPPKNFASPEPPDPNAPVPPTGQAPWVNNPQLNP